MHEESDQPRERRDARVERTARAPLRESLCDSSCPACGDKVATRLFDGGAQPLSTLAWPQSHAEAVAMERLPLRFVRCLSCGHVFNEAFDFAKVPYTTKPNLMYNRGALWRVHLERICEEILQRLPERPVVVEIGCGDGHLLRAIADRRPGGRYLGFDLNGRIDLAGGDFEAHPIRFEPELHIGQHRPDLVISRHLLEHLSEPLRFIQKIDLAIAWAGLDTRVFLEVPCIDRVFETGRTADFFYEHNSHFTTESFRRMLSRTTAELELVERGYDGEVVFGIARLGRSADRIRYATEAVRFRLDAERADVRVRAELDALARRGTRVAIWGGTGKGAAFINRNALDAVRFPLVVDSDAAKVGTYVPGTGQRIASPRVLVDEPAEVVLIATQWRARDIVLEMEETCIPHERVLLEDRSRLVDYFRDAHPYR